MENAEKFFETYCDFVTKVTSDPSLKIDDLKTSLDNIQENSPIDAPRLLTAALGLGSETGEFVEIVKKVHIRNDLILIITMVFPAIIVSIVVNKETS